MKNSKAALMAMDALCAGLFAFGTALIALPALGLPAAGGLCGAAVLLGLGACALWEWKPWLIPGVLGGCLVLAAAVAGLMGSLPEAAASAAGYIQWALGESLAGNPQLPVYFGAVLPLAVLFWVIMRKFPSLWLVTLLTAGAVSYKAILQPEGWLAPLLLLLAGMLLFLPRASLKGEGRLQAQLLAGILAVPVLGLSLLLGPQDSGEWRSRTVGHLVQDVQDFWEYHWGSLPALPVTSMRGMGLQPQRDRLGGDFTPNDSPVITSSQRLLLRGQALDVYTGTGWEDGDPQENGNFRYDSLFWLGRRQQALGADLPPQVSVPLLDDLLMDVNADLRALRHYRSLFLPYRTSQVRPERGGNELFFNMQGEAYWQSQPQSAVEYHVEGRAWNFRDKDFDRNMLTLERMLAGSGTDPAYAQAAEKGLQLPDALPGWVGELAAELTADSRSPYEKAIALRDYLSENCEYTLTPGESREGEDFVAAFLTERKGYCTYYASALTVLCRCAGIPARYVTGYGMTAEGKRYQATQATAHAWTEIYLAHTGWVPLDALSQDIFEQALPEPEASQEADGRAGPPPTPSPTPAASGEALGPEPVADRFNPLVLLWLIPAGIAAGFLLAGRTLRQRRYSLEYVGRKFPQRDQAAEHCYAGLLRLLRLKKISPQPGETLLAFWRRAAESLPQEEGVDWQEAGRILDRLRFGGAAPSEEEIAALCGMYQALLREIRGKSRLLGWFRA